MSIRIRDDNKIPDLLTRMKSLDSMKVELGIVAPSGDEVYMVAWVHEFGVDIPVTDKMRGWFLGQGMPLTKGTTHIRIPEKGYFRGGYDANESSISSRATQAVESVINGDMTAYDARDSVGEYASELIKSNVTGAGLVKSGTLRDSIGFRVVPK